jgi:pimeloyl-ACP methyl ester carboxylesterase
MELLTLPDGRELELVVSGPEDGPVLLFLHGTPGSSHQMGAMQDAAATHGHRLVTFSRAGYGASSRRAGRRVVDDTDDVAAVLDHVGAESCVVAGWSGGGPHALACGARLSDRVRAVAVVAGVTPYDADGLDFLAGMGEGNVEEFGRALQGEAQLRGFVEPLHDAFRGITADEVAAELDTLLPEVDRGSLTGEFADWLAALFRQAVAVSVDGWVDDDLAFTVPWGFEPADVQVPTSVWQGSEDLMVPFSHGQWLAERIPGVTAHLEHGEGHLTVLLGALPRWVGELVAHS